MPGTWRSIRMGARFTGVTIAVAACAIVTPAQNERNRALYTVARSCETGSLLVDRVSNEGLVHTRTMNSSGNEWAPFNKCYLEKAAPIWRTYCQAEPESPQCKR